MKNLLFVGQILRCAQNDILRYFLIPLLLFFGSVVNYQQFNDLLITFHIRQG